MNPLEAWRAMDARVVEHLNMEDPAALEEAAGGLRQVGEDLGLDHEQLHIAVAAKEPDLIKIAMSTSIGSAAYGAFVAGAFWKARNLESGIHFPVQQNGAGQDVIPLPICPACEHGSVGAAVLEDPALGQSIILSCDNGHRWDLQTGALV